MKTTRLLMLSFSLFLAGCFDSYPLPYGVVDVPIKTEQENKQY